MNDGVLVILPDVIIYKDVLHILVKGVDPKRLPPTNGEGVSGPPEEDKNRGLERRAKQRSRTGATVATIQSGPGTLPDPGPSSGTGTGLVLRHASTLGPPLGSARSPSCCSGSSRWPCSPSAAAGAESSVEELEAAEAGLTSLNMSDAT